MNNKFFKISLLSSLICLSLYSYGDDYFDPSMLESQLGIDPTQIDYLNLVHQTVCLLVPTVFRLK